MRQTVVCHNVIKASVPSLQSSRFRLNVSTLVLGCRDVAKGEAAKREIVGIGKGAERVLVWQVDMASYDSVKSFSRKVVDNLGRLDALLANAGISTNTFVRAEGLEQTLTVNVVSTFLLSRLCLPALERTAGSDRSPTHLTIVGSNVHAFADPSQITTAASGKVFSTLSDEKQAGMNGRYFLSKLLVQLCAQELATGIPELDSSSDLPSVIVNCPSPGWCKTPLFRQDDGGVIGRNMLTLIGRTAEIGARTLISAINAGPESHGQYLSECRVKNASVWTRSIEGEQTQKKIWNELEGILDNIIQ